MWIQPPIFSDDSLDDLSIFRRVITCTAMVGQNHATKHQGHRYKCKCNRQHSLSFHRTPPERSNELIRLFRRPCKLRIGAFTDKRQLSNHGILAHEWMRIAGWRLRPP